MAAEISPNNKRYALNVRDGEPRSNQQSKNSPSPIHLIKKVPAYVQVQVVGATLANGTIWLLFNGKHDHFVGNSPTRIDSQAFVVEFIVTLYLMFVICGVSTDNRVIGELAGLAIGATLLLNVLFAWPISSTSMNPARSLGSAILWNKYEGIWIYIVAPIVGGVIGVWAYTLVRLTHKSVRELTESGSFLKGLGRNNSN